MPENPGVNVPTRFVKCDGFDDCIVDRETYAHMKLKNKEPEMLDRELRDLNILNVKAVNADGGLGRWQPIETAPRTGEWIVVSDGEFVTIAWLQPDNGEVVLLAKPDCWDAATIWTQLPRLSS